MIERLLRALRDAAEGGASAALAGELSDALLLAESCQQVALSPEQLRALHVVELLLERDPGSPEVAVRAREALGALHAGANDSARAP